ncbi:MAG: hypothetical protein QOF48_3262 [Verrucomicrobiota bacterium]
MRAGARCRRNGNRPVPKFFAPNIDRAGRLIRALWGLVAMVVGILLWRAHWWAGVPCCLLALLAFYEAVRGWCIARACGIKTRY